MHGELAVEGWETHAAKPEEASRKIMHLGGAGWEPVDVETLTKDLTTTKLIDFFKRSK